ncbi:MAG TPA: hypothetical protein EYP85_15415 [Armatimonadetes bacterium]|nr:hypothetical protein [Armatimonadota bacterium]
MFVEALTPPIQDLLATLGQQPWLREYYLAGGTAAALQLGHRLSVDLDFFTPQELDTRTLIQHLSQLGSLTVDREDWGTLIGALRGVRVSFFTYEYPLLEPTVDFEGVTLASLVDIGLMKITAIAQRGGRRDFIDLYLICKEVISLRELLSRLAEKFVGVNYNLCHILRSLVYFEDAEMEPLPQLLKPLEWSTITAYFEREVKFLSRDWLR